MRHAHITDRAPTYHSASDHEHVHLVCRNCRAGGLGWTRCATTPRRPLHDEHGFDADVGHLTVFGKCGQCTER